MLKIAHLDTGPDLRGGQQQLLMLARGLRERGHEQFVVTLEGSVLEERAGSEGFRVFSFPTHDPAHAFGILLLRQLLRAQQIQILHAHDGKGQTLSWLASVGLNVRRVASRRVIFVPARRFDTRVKYGHTCDAVIAVSNYVRQLLADSGVAESKIEVIYDGVEIPEELPEAAARARVRAQWQWDCGDQDFVVGQISVSTQEKGLDVAGDAARLLEKSMPAARIVMAFAGTGRPGRILLALGGQVRGVDASGRPLVEYTSNVRQMVFPQNRAEFFAALDLFIMPSRAEGLGSAALLAMAYGVPVIASRVGGLPEIVVDGETGWLVPPGDPAALAEAIARAAADRARLLAMGEKARERARQFSSTLMVERTEAIYQKLLRVES